MDPGVVPAVADSRLRQSNKPYRVKGPVTPRLKPKSVTLTLWWAGWRPGLPPQPASLVPISGNSSISDRIALRFHRREAVMRFPVQRS